MTLPCLLCDIVPIVKIPEKLQGEIGKGILEVHDEIEHLEEDV